MENCLTPKNGCFTTRRSVAKTIPCETREQSSAGHSGGERQLNVAARMGHPRTDLPRFRGTQPGLTPVRRTALAVEKSTPVALSTPERDSIHRFEQGFRAKCSCFCHAKVS